MGIELSKKVISSPPYTFDTPISKIEEIRKKYEFPRIEKTDRMSS